MTRRAGAKKRVLIVNAFFDHLRVGAPRPLAVPQSMAPVFLAGAFAPDRCEVRTYNEQFRGPLADRGLLEWADLLVLTGLTNAFDRMLHLTAHARTLNPRVVVAAGGPAIRALPRYSRRFFDYVCRGDVEELTEVAEEVFGPGHATEEVFPRFDLADRVRGGAYVESSRYCNYRCTFCSLTGEGHHYQHYSVDFLRRQIEAWGRRRYVVFLDNNFYGNDPDFFRARLALLRELYEKKRIHGWAALVTSEFFLEDENLELARQSGCGFLFCGIESFDTAVLRSFRKRHSTELPQVELMRRCLEAGIGFSFGVMLDFTTRTLAELDEEIDFIVRNPAIPMPTYFTPVIPILGTPFFRDCYRKGLLLPSGKLRDFDTNTLALKPLDPIPEVAEFIRDLEGLKRYRARVPRRMIQFIRRYRRTLSLAAMRIVLASGLMTLAPALSAGFLFGRRPRNRTYVTTTEPLDSYYTPSLPVAPRYEDHFLPTMITDARGALTDEVHEDLLPTPRNAAAAPREALAVEL